MKTDLEWAQEFDRRWTAWTRRQEGYEAHEGSVLDLLAIVIAEARAESVAPLQKIIVGLTDRVAGQSELLSSFAQNGAPKRGS